MIYKVSVYDLMLELMFSHLLEDEIATAHICVNENGGIKIQDDILPLSANWKPFAPVNHYVEFLNNDEFTMLRKGDKDDRVEMQVLRHRIDEVMAAESYSIDIEVVD